MGGRDLEKWEALFMPRGEMRRCGARFNGNVQTLKRKENVLSKKGNALQDCEAWFDVIVRNGIS